MNPEPINDLLFDPIFDEIHQARRDYSDKFNGNFKLVPEDAQRRQETSGRPLWRPKTANTPKQSSSELAVTEDDKAIAA